MSEKYKGLSEKQAKLELKKHGKNVIKKTKKVNTLKIFISQFTSPLIILLFLAATVSFLVGYLPGQEPRLVDTLLILIIVFASGLAGFFQEYKAEKSIQALQKMATPKTTVIRNGRKKEIPVNKVVPGDIVVLKTGDVVPADSKILESSNLSVDESILTGESEAVNKKDSEFVYKNTSVYVGNAYIKVEKTGMDTKVGNIAKKLESIEDEKTPFELEMSAFSKKLIYAVLGIIFVIFLISLFKYSLYQSLLTSISLAVAAVPEGLPAVVSLSLALGARVMAKKKSLIRKLSVTESIGAVDVICSDKTGTLTRNEMSVSKIYTDKEFNARNFKKNNRTIHLLRCNLLCNNSEKQSGKYKGDQTEVALRKFAEKFIKKLDYERIKEVPFSSKRKLMSVLVKKNKNKIVYSKGAPEYLIKKCNRILINGKVKELTPELKKQILEKNKEFASQGLRVLGFAYKNTKSENNLENDLIWLGLEGMRDPPHKEVKKALKDCKTAGIRVIMITGDNSLTAKSIANEIGLNSEESLEGKDIDKLSDKQLEKKLQSGVNIFARVDPFHKLRILEILKKNYRVAMTGDGVNDALALKKADVGISMGIRGTEVAKQSSDIILLDDNFSSIKDAVKEGRRIFQNIRKFVNYLLISNLAEVLVLFLATLFLTLEEPILLPIHLLWINLLTDGLPALALGVDPAKKDIMKEKPRKKGEKIMNRRFGFLIVFIGLLWTLILFATFFLVRGLGIDVARTTLFTGFVLYELVRIGVIRSQEKLNWFSNKWLLGAISLSILLQLSILYTPLNKLFHVTSLGIYPWIVLISGVVIGYFLAISITKLIVKYTEEK